MDATAPVGNPCPSCGQSIPAANINVSEGVALCAACGKLARLSEIVAVEENNTALIDTPHGCSTTVVGDEICVRASMRSCGGAAFLLVFAAFWNGVLSIFLLTALGALYARFVGNLPSWFSTPTSSPGMGMGELAFMCLFLLPFVVIGLGVLFGAFMCLFGYVEVRISALNACVYTGVGPLRWPRRFDPARVKAVKIDKTTYQQNDQHKPLIQIEADRIVRFGSMLSKDRLDWMRATLFSILIANKGKLPAIAQAPAVTYGN